MLKSCIWRLNVGVSVLKCWICISMSLFICMGCWICMHLHGPLSQCMFPSSHLQNSYTTSTFLPIHPIHTSCSNAVAHILKYFYLNVFNCKMALFDSLFRLASIYFGMFPWCLPTLSYTLPNNNGVCYKNKWCAALFSHIVRKPTIAPIQCIIQKFPVIMSIQYPQYKCFLNNNNQLFMQSNVKNVFKTIQVKY